jgi:hypothetical protein
MADTSAWKPVAEATAPPSAWKPVEESKQEKSWLDQLADVPRGIWNQLSQTGQGMVDIVTHKPLDTIKSIGASQDAVRLKAEEAFKKGDYVSGVRHVIGYLVPGVGPAIDQAGDKAQAGNVGEGIGEALSIGGQMAVPGALAKPGVVEAVAAAPTAIKGAARGALTAVSDPALLMQTGGAEIAGHYMGIPPAVTAAGVALPRVLRSTIQSAKAALAARAAAEAQASRPVPGVLVEATPEASAGVPIPEVPPAAGARVPLRPPLSKESVAPAVAAAEPPRTLAQVAQEPPAPAAEPWNPEASGPDPFKQTEAYRRGVQAMLERRKGYQKPQPIEATQPAPAAFMDSEATGVQIPQVANARAAVADAMAKHFYDYGITGEQIAALEANKPAWRSFWDQAGQIPGVSKQKNYRPSAETIDAVRDRLGEMEKGGGPKNPAVEPPSQPTGPLAANPKARAIAEQLAEEMSAQQVERPAVAALKAPKAKPVPEALVDLVPAEQWDAFSPALRKSLGDAAAAGDMKRIGTLLKGPAKGKK